jgi:hypothetical protein
MDRTDDMLRNGSKEDGDVRVSVRKMKALTATMVNVGRI